MGRQRQKPTPVVAASSSDDVADSHDSGDDIHDAEPNQPAEVDLYAEFNIPRDAPEVEIKKAYRRLCLLYHPDKLSTATEAERLAATEKFQQIASWYGILSDPAKRARYDQTGSLDERGIEFMDKGDATWYDFFRNMWGELTLKDIDEYAKKYQGSDEEKKDVLDAFAKTKGNLLAAIDQHIPLSHIDDLPRYRAIVQSAMDNEEIPRTAIKEDPRELKKLRAAAARELAMLQKDQKAEAEANCNALSLIAERAEKRKQDFGDMIANLTEKYVKKPGAKRKGGGTKAAQPPPELSDADFEAVQKGLMERQGWKSQDIKKEENQACGSADRSVPAKSDPPKKRRRPG
ncbi:hypothetical protein HDU87_002149 [Geranomyces variabilis]|uniref:J domain-containing protein n=1 Tax=Geranomyces variabilis TaxID=109894 RepID=A0AAD5TRL4_9FUNG|nr:hypothetical protein HDU87_002149 [Geranomyces variabilis]